MLTEATAAAQTKQCPVCGATFSRNRHYSLAQWARATYCSNRCRGATLSTPRALCACGCGVRVSKPGSRFAQGHNTRTEEFRAAHAARDWKRGPEHHSYKHGGLRYHHTAEHKAWRSAVFARDAYTCQDCGRRRVPGDRVILEAHHIKPYAQFPEMACDIDNGITLCMRCHRVGRHGKGC